MPTTTTTLDDDDVWPGRHLARDPHPCGGGCRGIRPGDYAYGLVACHRLSERLVDVCECCYTGCDTPEPF